MMGAIREAGGHALPVDVTKEEGLQRVDLFAPARLVQPVLPLMRRQRSGTIVKVSSIGGEIALPLGAWYHASKHALQAFSDTLRMETRQFGIDVVVIQPGIIRTDFEAGTARQLREISGNGAYREMAEALLELNRSLTDREFDARVTGGLA